MNWSGQSPGRPGPGASSAPLSPGVGPSQRGPGTRWTSQVHDGQPNPFLNAITKQNSNDPGPPKPDIRLEKSKAEMQILIRLAEKAGNTRSILYSHFSTTPNPSLSCLTLATQNKDFSLGKFEKSLTALVLTEFETWSRENSPAELSEPEKDLVFHLFSGHGNLKVITTAFSVFSLQCDRYYNVINEFCASNDYKRASQVAVALNSVNVFDISLFCVPLLIQGNLATLEQYLNIAAIDLNSASNSAPSAAKTASNSALSLLLFLDSLIKHPYNLDQFNYVPKPRGLPQLAGKPLEKLIKKYSGKYEIDLEHLPNLYNKLTVQDLIYWTSEIRNTDSEKLFSWRELMEAKLELNPNLHSLFLNKLVRYDQDETIYWSEKLGFRTPEIAYLFRRMEIKADEEDDWDKDCRSSPRSPAKSDSSVKKNTAKEKEKEEENGEDEFWEEEATTPYFQLPFKSGEIKMVIRLEELHECADILNKESIVGVDGEFTASPHVKKLSILQLSSASAAFLLDMTALSLVVVQAEDWQPIINIFTNKDILIVGFGIVEDLNMLSKTAPALAQISKKSQGVLCLDILRSRISHFLALKQTAERGLSGFTEIILGQKLNKADQKSNWDRRPLRESQRIYAALDAYVCVKLYLQLTENAENVDKTQEFRQAVDDVIHKRPDRNPKSNDNSNVTLPVELLRAPLNPSPISPANLRVVCDTMLQGVCKKLRVCGIDAVALENCQNFLECVQLVKTKSEDGEGPVYVLSRGVPADKLSKRLPAGHCLSIKNDNIEQQLGEVLRYFNVEVKESDLFSRCVLCNGDKYITLSGQILLQILDAVSAPKVVGVPAGYDDDDDDSDDDIDFVNLRDEESDEDIGLVVCGEPAWVDVKGGKVDPATGRIQHTGVKICVTAVPRPVFQPDKEFWVCTKCGKIYWQGSHWDKAQMKYGP